MEKYYRFAGIELAVCASDDIMYSNEQKLSAFRVDHVDDPHVFYMEMVPQLSVPTGICMVSAENYEIYCDGNSRIRYIAPESGDWKEATLRVRHEGKKHWVQMRSDVFTKGINAKVVTDCIEAEHLIARKMGYILHCSYIVYNGRAVLFTAPSGTGKTTQAELWQKYRNAEIINGDRAAVRLVDGTLMAEGIPYAGGSPYCKDRSLPITAIVYLGQAPETTIRRVRGAEAFFKLWEGVSVQTWDKADMENVSAVVQRTAAQIPIYHMPCTPDEAAVAALETELRKLVTE